jgi:hypothetical protein
LTSTTPPSLVGGQGKPLEINDPHQWGLRYASDDMQTTDHVLCAVIALKKGIKNYVMQHDVRAAARHQRAWTTWPR